MNAGGEQAAAVVSVEQVGLQRRPAEARPGACRAVRVGLLELFEEVGVAVEEARPRMSDCLCKETAV